MKQPVLPVLVLVLSLCILCAAGAQTLAYQVHCTSPLDLLVPHRTSGADAVLFRDHAGDWHPAETTTVDGLVQVEIDAGKLEAGQTIVLFGKPSHIDLSDQKPPEVVGLQIGDHSYPPADEVALGGVGEAPGKIRIEVADDKNWLRRKSFNVSANGRRFDTRTDGVDFERVGPRRAVIAVDPAAILDGLSRQNSIIVGIDDYAVDDRSLTFSLTFDYVAGHRMQDGTVVYVDSVTDADGWQDWDVVVDGEHMDEGSGTTAGRTWLSKQSAQPHWIRMEFPQQREISEVKLWWAHYQVFRTSRAYRVQTWNGEEWVTQVSVEDQAPRQVSEHEFGPVETTAVRVWQPPHSGQAQRPDRMWLSEIEIN